MLISDWEHQKGQCSCLTKKLMSFPPIQDVDEASGHMVQSLTSLEAAFSGHSTQRKVWLHSMRCDLWEESASRCIFYPSSPLTPKWQDGTVWHMTEQSALVTCEAATASEMYHSALIFPSSLSFFFFLWVIFTALAWYASMNPSLMLWLRFCFIS